MLIHQDAESVLNKSRCELDHLIVELVKSERDFIDDLVLCHINYVLPLAKSFQVNDIFMNLETIIHLHEAALRKLPACLDKPMIDYSSIYEIFKFLLRSIVDAYIYFCSHQRESIRLLMAKMASDVRFRQLVNECQRNLVRLLEPPLAQSRGSINVSSCNSLSAQEKSRITRNLHLPLDSYLLKPMQRITKYSLLFERIDKVSRHKTENLKATTRYLKEQAQYLCNQVNEACRLKEDNESNQRKLQWCQTHLVQAKGATQNTRMSEPASLLSVSVESNKSKMFDEIIMFDSKTSCMGERRYLKSGSFMKHRSANKELVLFLFNDLLLMTKVKSYGPPLKINDVFASPRAQQSYYKLYHPPILLEDIVLLNSTPHEQSMAPSPSPSTASRSSWNENQHLAINFSDRSTGSVLCLLALDEQEKQQWTQELIQKSMEAREARARQQAQHLARAIRRPNVINCCGRLFVTVVELIGDMSYSAAGDGIHTGEIRTRFSNILEAMSITKVSVQMQTRRVRTVLVDLLEDKKETAICPTSDLFKTQAVKVNITKLGESDSFSSLVTPDCLAHFNEECTQFLLEKKSTNDGPDYLEVGIIDGSKFRESYLIARQKINLDQLINADAKNPSSTATESSDSSRLRPDRPSEFVFKLRLVGSRAIKCNEPLSGISDSGSQQTLERRQSLAQTDLSVKLRFHLQLFSS